MCSTTQFSVAMCTYNGEKYLREQLDSIAAQSILPTELVVCDDGSRDQTVTILSEFADQAPFPVKVYENQETLGVARNFFKAIRLCSADWVILCDQDDVWLPERIAIFSAEIEKNVDENIDIVFSNAFLTDQFLTPNRQTLFSAYRLKQNEINWINQGKAEKALVRHVFITGAAMIVRRDFAKSVPEPVVGFLHDEWLSWMACPRLLVLNECTLFYRQHPEQVTGADGRIQAQYQRLAKPQMGKTVNINDAVDRFTQLLQAYSSSNGEISNSVINTLTKKIHFLRKRSQLSAGFFQRIIGILGIGLAQYWQLSSGFRTVLKDIFGLGRL